MDDINKVIGSLRTDYNKTTLDEASVNKNPFKQFEAWMKEAIESGVNEPHAMNLATIHNDRVSSRIVLLRDFAERGFSFFTNYGSKKATELDNGNYCAINFFWEIMQRQVRIEGTVSKLSVKESDEYFESRPRESQIGAHASAQSAILKNRKQLDENFENLTKQFEGKPVPRPHNWGGYLIMPVLFEFWQGRSNRLHDRIQYTLDDNTWRIDRLAP